MLRKELGDRAYRQLEAEMEGDWDEEVFDRAMDRILAGDIGDVSGVASAILRVQGQRLIDVCPCFL